MITILSGCGATKTNMHKTPLPSFDVEGHRGARGLMPENTIPAMMLALDLGVTTLEMDVVITADHKVILSHEPFFNHDISTHPGIVPITADNEKQYNIFKMSYEETKMIDVGSKQHPRFPRQKNLPAAKPLLSVVIDSAEAHAKQNARLLPFYNIETKSHPSTDGVFHPSPAEFVDLLMAVIKEKKISDRVIIQSFDFRTLKEVHNRYKGIRTAALVEGTDNKSPDQQLAELGFVPDIYSPYFLLVTPSLISFCHDKGMKIIPWTVNDKETIQALKTMGVDGIITDYPDLFTNE
ncbi:glycerophosphodiester phosphodiesterase [Flavihumibacter sediminis]|nr:glycerophosphodiester phosphodiesterase [Flavihumibacter sediminis]